MWCATDTLKLIEITLLLCWSNGTCLNRHCGRRMKRSISGLILLREIDKPPQATHKARRGLPGCFVAAWFGNCCDPQGNPILKWSFFFVQRVHLLSTTTTTCICVKKASIRLQREARSTCFARYVFAFPSLAPSFSRSFVWQTTFEKVNISRSTCRLKPASPLQTNRAESFSGLAEVILFKCLLFVLLKCFLRRRCLNPWRLETANSRGVGSLTFLFLLAHQTFIPETVRLVTCVHGCFRWSKGPSCFSFYLDWQCWSNTLSTRNVDWLHDATFQS